MTSVGGGPAGLFYAALAKRRFPTHRVTVVERNAPAATFGFGVVFSERTLGDLRDADPETTREIDAASVAWEDIEVRHRGRVLRCAGHGFSAISRRDLLAILQHRARDAGAELRFETEAGLEDVVESDLILAADGVNSSLRAARTASFGTSSRVGAAKYIWFATEKLFDALTFVFVEDEHGHWAAHAYPFDRRTSTFIVETDEGTWRRAGLDVGTEGLAPGESDLRSLRYCERLFSGHLDGAGLFENNSKWLAFPTVRNERWRDGNVVLLGDAAHTAHFSVGSGTKMALEDAVALADAVGETDAIEDALERYEAARRPSVERIQRAAEPSRIWWETFRRVADRPTEQFAFHFLTRSPIVTRDRLRARDPRFVQAIERAFAGAEPAGPPPDCPLARPFDLFGQIVPSRVVAVPLSLPAGAGADLEEAPLVALGGLALAGAGVVLADGELLGLTHESGWERIVAWIHEHTPALVGFRAELAELVDATRLASRTGFDLLAATVEQPSHESASSFEHALSDWPPERPALLTVTAPRLEDEIGAAHVAAFVRELLERRTLLVGVRPARPDIAHRADAEIAQLVLCDRLRTELGVGIVLVGARDDDAAATAILAGRADLCQGTPSIASRRWTDEGSGRLRGREAGPIVTTGATG